MIFAVEHHLLVHAAITMAMAVTVMMTVVVLVDRVPAADHHAVLVVRLTHVVVAVLPAPHRQRNPNARVTRRPRSNRKRRKTTQPATTKRGNPIKTMTPEKKNDVDHRLVAAAEVQVEVVAILLAPDAPNMLRVRPEMSKETTIIMKTLLPGALHVHARVHHQPDHPDQNEGGKMEWNEEI